MSSAIDIGHVVPPIQAEFEPPSEVDWSQVEDETLRGLLIESARRRNVFLQELWRTLVDGINWAGARRELDGRLYRYDDDAEAWLSIARPVLWTGSATPGSAAYLDLVGGITSSSSIGFYLPQDCTIVRWWGSWTTGAAASTTLDLRADGASLKTWTAAGSETDFSEDALVDADAGELLAVDIASNTAPMTNVLVGMEIAWRTTFSA